jgi:tyrosine-protein kinase Etk/Wzc
MQPSQDHLLGVITAFFRWKRPILWATGAAALITTIICFLLPNYYQARTTFLAASPDQFKPEMIFGLSTSDMEFYGEDIDIDRLLSIGKSTELMHFMIDSFDLYKHYGIDSTKNEADFKVRKKFKKLFDIQKTKFDGIELTMEDKDPELAAKMATAARSQINKVACGLIKQSQGMLIQTYRQSLLDKNTGMVALADTMRWLRTTYGIADANEQGRLIAELLTTAESSLARDRAKLGEYSKMGTPNQDTLQNIRARIRGHEEEIKGFRGGGGSVDLNRFNAGRDQLKMIDDIHEEQSEKLGEDRERLANLEAVFGANIASVNVIEEAEVPMRKSRPVRSIIIAAATILTFVLSALVAMLLDQYRNLNWNKIFKGEDAV